MTTSRTTDVAPEMNELDRTGLTNEQLAQASHYNSKDGFLERINLDQYSQRRFGPWNPYWHVNDLVRQHFRSSTQKLLSFGCGAGKNAILYAKMGYDVSGFDISQRRIDNAKFLAEKYNCSDKTHFEVQTAENLNYPSSSFDIVVGVNILHHIDVQRAVPEVFRVLKPGGIAVFKEPLETTRRDRIRNSWMVTKFLPKGVKSIPERKTYTLSLGEHKINEKDFMVIKEHADSFEIKRWRVLTLLNAFLSNRPFLERCDWALFRVLPFVRRFGDQAVLIAKKAP